MLRTKFHHFVSADSGAVAVDWVVLAAATVGLGVASVGAVRLGSGGLADSIESSLVAATVPELDLRPVIGTWTASTSQFVVNGRAGTLTITDTLELADGTTAVRITTINNPDTPAELSYENWFDADGNGNDAPEGRLPAIDYSAY